MIVDQIRKDRMKARKAQDNKRTGILTVLLGDIENASKRGSMGDSEVIAMVKKYISNCEEKLSYNEDLDLRVEIEVLSQYLPQQLNKDEIEAILRKAIKTGQVSHIGEAMGFMKTYYNGRYDGKVANQRAMYLLTRE